MNWDKKRGGFYCNRCDVSINVGFRSNSGMLTRPLQPYLAASWFGGPGKHEWGSGPTMCFECGQKMLPIAIKHFRSIFNNQVCCLECGVEFAMGDVGGGGKVDEYLSVRWSGTEPTRRVSDKFKDLLLCVRDGEVLLGELDLEFTNYRSKHGSTGGSTF